MTRLAVARAGRRAIGVLGLLLGLVAVPLALLLVVTSLRGDRLVVVESGSMAPTYRTGSLLVVSPTRASEVEVGDVVAFADESMGGALVSHRVVRAIEGGSEGQMFVTQGDANASEDPDPVPASALRGRVVRSIPAVGALGWLLERSTALVLFVALPLLLVVLDALLARRGGSIDDPATGGGAPTAAGPAPAAAVGT